MRAPEGVQLQAGSRRYFAMSGSDTYRAKGPAFNGAGEWPFDAWLRRSLAANHDQALREEVPQEWLALIDRMPARTG